MQWDVCCWRYLNLLDIVMRNNFIYNLLSQRKKEDNRKLHKSGYLLFLMIRICSRLCLGSGTNYIFIFIRTLGSQFLLLLPM